MTEIISFEIDAAIEAGDTGAKKAEATLEHWQTRTLHNLHEVEGLMDALENAGMTMQFEAAGDEDFIVRWRKAA